MNERGQSKIEAEHRRSFITQTYDDFRFFMGMDKVRVDRRWDYIGTTNKSDYNVDPFNRRDWAVEVGIHGRRIDLPRFQQLYAKITGWAVHNVKNGVSAIPDYGLYEKARVKQESRIGKTDLMDVLKLIIMLPHVDKDIISEAKNEDMRYKYQVSYTDDSSTGKRTYMVGTKGLSKFVSDYKNCHKRFKINDDKKSIAMT
jgi:hypothetical protein